VLDRTTITPVDAVAHDGGMQHVLHRDYETRSRAILKTVGAHQYAADPSTEITCIAFAVDGEPVRLWTPGDAIPAEFITAAADPAWLVAAHNDAFEAAIEIRILGPRYGFPLVPINRHRCTMAMALAAGLPARLDHLADALELANRKDGAGQRLMLQMSKPRRAHKDEDQGQIYWFEDQERLDRLYAYCRQDVEIERELFTQLPALSAAEQRLWELSTTINIRGFRVDRALATAARKIAEAAAPELDAELAEITAGAVTSIGQIARLQAWLTERGCPLETLDRKTVAQALEADNLPANVRRVLELRAGGAQSAAKKIGALLARAGEDDRIRGAFRFHGAATGRWSGDGFQPQNLKKAKVDAVDAAIAAISTGDYAHVRGLYPKPLAIIGDCTRSMICAAPGHTLIGADFSSIESRVLAWIAGEEWKLDSYRRFDPTHDPRDEPYCVTACKIFRVPDGSYTKDSPERSTGKTCDLAFGYMGGLAAWRKFEPERFTDDEVKQFLREWRASHPRIKAFWYNIDRAAVTAMLERGRVVRCGAVAFRANGSFLALKLPNGRKLLYPQSRSIGDSQRQHIVFADNAGGRFTDCRNGQGAYGGLWTENVVQAISRDLLAEAMLRIEVAGYPIVLHLHDELVAEVPEGFGSTDEFSHLMTRRPAWALDLPIAASAWTGKRYCK
jgi:DNA polymerase bacteriophage-type